MSWEEAWARCCFCFAILFFGLKAILYLWSFQVMLLRKRR